MLTTVTCSICALFTPAEVGDSHAIGLCKAVTDYYAEIKASGRKIRPGEYEKVQDAIGNKDLGKGRFKVCRPLIERDCKKFIPV